MYFNIVFPLACVTAFMMDEVLLSISPAGCGQFVKMLFTIETYVKFCILIYFNIVQPLFAELWWGVAEQEFF